MNKLTTEQLTDFVSRAAVQLNPELTQQLFSVVSELEQYRDKLENANEVNVYYKSPYKIGYAIVEYYARKNKPLKVVEYCIYGEELKTGKQLICWEWVSSTNFSIKEDGFKTEDEAKTRLKKLKENQYESNTH